MKIALLFPGQGSQYLEMGKGFVESDQDCAKIMEQAGEICGFDLKEICFNGPMEELTRATILQPAITAINIICQTALLKALPTELAPACYAGHSLGEYTALYSAGVLSLNDTLKIVAKRGALMEREGNNNPGGMRAVLGLGIEDIEKAIDDYTGDGVVTIANHNTPQQIVVSGDTDALDKITALLAEQGAKVIALNVSVANHSPLVADAVPDFAEYMAAIEFAKPEKPVLFNVTADVEDDGEVIKQIMASQIASRVRWYEIIEKMLADGVDTFIEVGPKTVLKGMMRKIVPKDKKVTAMQVDSPDTLAKCIEKLSSTDNQ